MRDVTPREAGVGHRPCAARNNQDPNSLGWKKYRRNKVPAGTDLLVTHGPPRGHLDLGHIGCASLLSELWRIRSRLHVFGHVHEACRQARIQYDAFAKGL